MLMRWLAGGAVKPGFIFAICIVWTGATSIAQADCVSETLAFANIQRSYVLCLPAEMKTGLPVLVLLHGSGSSGAYIASLWKDFAASEGIVLVAPDALHNGAWHLKDDSPAFLHAMANDVQTRTAADR